jgi:hypothetical protein
LHGFDWRLFLFLFLWLLRRWGGRFLVEARNIQGLLIEGVTLLLTAGSLQFLEMVVYLFDEIGEARSGYSIRVRVSRRRYRGTEAVLQIDNGAFFVGLVAVFHTFLNQAFLGFIFVGDFIGCRWKRYNGFAVGPFTDGLRRLNRGLFRGEQFAQWLAQVTDIVSPFGEKKCRSRATTRILAADNVFTPFYQLSALDPYHAPGNIPCVAKCSLGKLITVANVDPHGAFVDHAMGFLIRDFVYQRITDQLDERFFVETHQHTVGAHGHGCITGSVRNQGFLAETVPGSQLCQMYLAPAAGGLTTDIAVTFLDDVVVTAWITLADDQFVRRRIHTFHALEDTLNVLRWQVCKALRLQHTDHPVRRLLSGDISIFQVRRSGIEIRQAQFSFEVRSLYPQ